MVEFNVSPDFTFEVDNVIGFSIVAGDVFVRSADNSPVVRFNPWVIISRETANLNLIRLSDNSLFQRLNDNQVIERL